MKQNLKRIWSHLLNSAITSAEMMRPRLRVIGLIGLIGYPIYFPIWTWLFPQPYENLPLRLAAAALCVPLVIPERWPLSVHRFHPILLLGGVTFLVPFFFLFMALQNDFNAVWSGTAVISVMIVMFLVEPLIGILIMITGTTLAILAAQVSLAQVLSHGAIAEQIPVMLFAAVSMTAMALTARSLPRSRLLAATALAGHLAHELRTPLTSIEHAASYLADRLARDTSDPGRAEPDHPTGAPGLQPIPLEQVPRDIMLDVRYCTLVIDLLLANARSLSMNAQGTRPIDVAATIRDTVAQYPFDTPEERTWVRLHFSCDCRSMIDPLILKHVIQNLIKNAVDAIRAMGRTNDGAIRISLGQEQDEDQAIIRCVDNGRGICADDLRHLFEPFFSTRRSGGGLGLHFVREALVSLGGKVRCESEPGTGATFILHLPIVDRASDA